jgi:predicted transcriptional regulator
MNHIKADLGALEQDVMQLVWSRGTVTADAVRAALARPLKESTIRTVLRRLEDKGYVRHTIEIRTFTYSATEPRERVAAKAVKRIVDWFCNGSVEDVLVGMVDSNMLDQDQLSAIAKRLSAAQEAKSKKSAPIMKGRKSIGEK